MFTIFFYKIIWFFIILIWILLHSEIFISKYLEYSNVQYFYTFFIKNYIKNNENLRYNKIYWLDIWEINTNNLLLEKTQNLPWNMYYKYKLSIINSWHILEDRIIIFFCFFIFLI